MWREDRKNPLDILEKLNKESTDYFNPLDRGKIMQARGMDEATFQNSSHERRFINRILEEVIGVDEYHSDEEFKQLGETLKKMGCDKYLEFTSEELAERYGYNRGAYEKIATDNTLYPGIIYIRSLMKGDSITVAYANDRMGEYMPAYLERSKKIRMVIASKEEVADKEAEIKELEAKLAEAKKAKEKAEAKLTKREGDTGISIDEI